MGSSARSGSVPKLMVAMALAALVAVPTALAAEDPNMTRDAYIAKVEPICKANTAANSRILKGVKGQVQKGKLVPAGKRFVRAATALGKAVNQIVKVPLPPEDATKLTKWIGYLKSERTYLQQIGGALKAENKFRAQKLASQLNRNNNKANNTVISFDFDECRIDSSKFV